MPKRKLLYARKLFADTLTLLEDPEITFINVQYIGTTWEGRTNHILRDLPEHTEENKLQLTWCYISKVDIRRYSKTLPSSAVCSACVRSIMAPSINEYHKNFGEPQRREKSSG